MKANLSRPVRLTGEGFAALLSIGFVAGMGTTTAIFNMVEVPEREPFIITEYVTPGIPYCSSEEGLNAPCVWNAQFQGNGEGQSFIALADGTTVYLTPTMTIESVSQISVATE